MKKNIPAPATGDTEWFTRDRFGLFIHWGLYAMAARHEWVKHTEKIPDETYDSNYFRHFDPDLYDPTLWAKAAAGAGMKYFVITTKHHEGFCLWDSKLTDYKATNTPAKRDLLRPMVEAFRSEGLRTGFYHSLIDWHHPHYRLDPVFGPYREHPDREKMNEGRDQTLYAQYLRGQVKELLSEFGKIDISWFDFSYNERPGGKGRADWESEKLIALIRSLQPNIILNDRLDLPDGWDLKTPEQYQPREPLTVNGKRVVWEACQTFSGSWGYHRDESSWKSLEMLVTMLIDTVSKDGNLLLNIGPTSRGEFDARALERLAGMGRWMHHHSRSIYGCTQAPAEFSCPQDCRLTYNPEKKRLYVHLLSWPFLHLFLDGQNYADRVEYAQLLNDGSEIVQTQLQAHELCGQKTGAGKILKLPTQKPDVVVPVIELFLK